MNGNRWSATQAGPEVPTEPRCTLIQNVMDNWPPAEFAAVVVLGAVRPLLDLAFNSPLTLSPTTLKREPSALETRSV